MLRLIRFIRGYVHFRIFGKYPERFINLSLKKGIGIFDTDVKDGAIYASAVVSDYRCIRSVARKSGVKLRITEKHGLPFILYRFRNRAGILVGIALMILMFLILQNFVWTIDINGVKTLSETEIMAELSERGFKIGCFKGSQDLHKISREIQLMYDKIGWMSINLIDTHAQVEIKEKEVRPDAEYSSQFTNIKANTDGVILSTDIRRGTSEVSVGSAVSEGQLLVSGMYENALGEIHFVDADAEIKARTYHSYSATCDEEELFIQPEEITSRSALSLLWFKMPVTFTPEEKYTTQFVESRKVYLLDNPIPLILHSEKLVSYNPERFKIDENTAREKLNVFCELYKLFSLQNATEIKEQKYFGKNENGYYMNTEFICVERIGEKEKLIVNEY